VHPRSSHVTVSERTPSDLLLPSVKSRTGVTEQARLPVDFPPELPAGKGCRNEVAGDTIFVARSLWSVPTANTTAKTEGYCGDLERSKAIPIMVEDQAPLSLEARRRWPCTLLMVWCLSASGLCPRQCRTELATTKPAGEASAGFLSFQR